MKRETKPRRRSSSKKRRRSSSKGRREDDSILVKMLDERAMSDRQITLSKEKYNQLKSANTKLKETQARINVSSNEIAKLKEENERLYQENQRLQCEFGTPKKENLYTLQSSLAQIEKLLKYRAVNTKRLLKRCNRILANHAKTLLDQGHTLNQKSAITKNLAEISNCIEQVLTLVCSNTSDISDHNYLEEENYKLKLELEVLRSKEKEVEKYKKALSEMRNQTQQLRDRLNELENDSNLKNLLHDQENKIQLLQDEKKMLNEHISTLQSTLSEQSHVIDHLKEVISSFASTSPSKDTVSPSKASQQFSFSPESDKASSPGRYQIGYRFDTLNSRNSERNLQAEISSLDLEIQQLQSSLQKVLSNY